MIAINSRTVHGSRANATNRVRPVALFVYSSGRCLHLDADPDPDATGEIVRGQPATVAHLDPIRAVPPDWSKQGYGSIFTAQNAEL